MFVSSLSVIVTFFSDVVGLMPVLGNTSLYPWERHLTLISLQDLCVVWKTAQVSASQRHIPEKKNQIINKLNGTAIISESGSGQQLPFA